MGTVCKGDVCRHKTTVFFSENEFSSREAVRRHETEQITREVEIALPAGATELSGEFIHVKSRLPLRHLLECSIMSGRGRNSCFSYRAAYVTLDEYVRYLNDKLGIDLNMWRAFHSRPRLPLPVTVNFPGMDNAYFDPETESLTFGDGFGRIPFAQEGDCDLHEGSHWLVHTFNPLLTTPFFSYGDALHEGIADAGAALFTGDPENGEDLSILTDGRPNPRGMRTAKNDSSLRAMFGRGSSNETDPYVIGGVFNGFFWSLAERFEQLMSPGSRRLSGPESAETRRRALDAALKIMFVHLTSYEDGFPSFEDFRPAVLAAARALLDDGVLTELTDRGLTFRQIETAINEEAKRRGFIWFEGEMCRKPAPPPRIMEGTAFEPVAMRSAELGGRQMNFHRQTYRTRAHGTVPVIGRGKVVVGGSRGRNRPYMDGVLEVTPGSVDETVDVDKRDAFRRVIASVDEKIKEAMESRYPSLKFSDADIAWIVDALKQSLTRGGLGKMELALLPAAQPTNACSIDPGSSPPKLVWHIETGSVAVSIDAKSGAVAEFRIKMKP